MSRQNMKKQSLNLKGGQVTVGLKKEIFKKEVGLKAQFRYTEVKSKDIPVSADELIRSREARTKARSLFCTGLLQKREKKIQSLMTLGEFSKSPLL